MKKMLKIIAIIIALTVSFSGNVFATDDVTATEPQENTNIILGDVSGDGKVSILDSAYVFFHVLGLRKLSEEAIAGGDVNGDGKLSFDDMSEINLREYYPDFYEYEGCCKFNGCVHINEPKCAVKDALLEGKISKTRYENYKLLYNEINDKRKY